MIGEKLFYQYRRIVANDENFTLNNLANNQLYFKHPSDFNDPFDCKIYLDEKGTREQWIDWHIKKKFTLKEAENIIDSCFEVKGDFVYPRVNKDHREGFYGDIKSISLPRVCCFSEKCKSILMWSHYADCHKGICLCFKAKKELIGNNEYSVPLYSLHDTLQEAPYSGQFKEVQYKCVVPPVNIFDDYRDEKVNHWLTTKFYDWHYEYEYRMLFPESNLEDGLIKYNKRDLDGIIFGLKINHNNAKLVYDTVKKNYLDKGVTTVNFYKAIEAPRKYAVEIKPIDDIEKYIDSRPKDTNP